MDTIRDLNLMHLLKASAWTPHTVCEGVRASNRGHLRCPMPDSQYWQHSMNKSAIIAATRQSSRGVSRYNFRNTMDWLTRAKLQRFRQSKEHLTPWLFYCIGGYIWTNYDRYPEVPHTFIAQMTMQGSPANLQIDPTSEHNEGTEYNGRNEKMAQHRSYAYWVARMEVGRKE